jgi:copper chaperone
MFKSITFEVIGDQRLVCEGCEQRVERLLKALSGVGQVRAQAHSQRIEVLFDTAGLESAAIADRLGQAGYETRVRQFDSRLIRTWRGPGIQRQRCRGARRWQRWRA